MLGMATLAASLLPGVLSQRTGDQLHSKRNPRALDPRSQIPDPWGSGPSRLGAEFSRNGILGRGGHTKKLPLRVSAAHSVGTLITFDFWRAQFYKCCSGCYAHPHHVLAVRELWVQAKKIFSDNLKHTLSSLHLPSLQISAWSRNELQLS